MKKQASQKEVDALVVRCRAAGWKVDEDNGITSCVSPMSSLMDWATITISGRKIRTTCSYDVHHTKPGMWMAIHALGWMEDMMVKFPAR